MPTEDPAHLPTASPARPATPNRTGDRAYWTALPRGLRAAEVAATARRAEERGFAGVVAAQVYGPPWAPLGIAASATTDLRLASGIAMGLVRSPFETACAAIDLAAASGDRFTLGLGTAPPAWNGGFFGVAADKPVSRLGELIDIVRHVDAAALAGTAPGPWEGRFHRLAYEGFEPTWAPRTTALPIWVAALRERLCELAGAKADGLIGHPVWSVDFTLGPALDALARGAAAAGRDPAALDLQLWLTVSMDEDRAAAVQRAKGNVAFYGGIAEYRPFFAAHGFGAEAERLAEARRSQPVAACADLVPDEMAATFVVCGTRDDVESVLDRLWQRAGSMVVRPPSWGIDREEYTRRVQELDAVLLGPAG